MSREPGAERGAYLANHTSIRRFPQQTRSFASASFEAPEYAAFAAPFSLPERVTGSVDPADMRARYRTPVEVGWQRAVRFDVEREA